MLFITVGPPVRGRKSISFDAVFTHMLTIPQFLASARVYRVEVLAIVGPTGTGKSELALDIAQKLPVQCEVINADAFSLYRGMDIGTAKVLPSERRGIPHHLIDILDPLEVASIADYQSAGWGAIDAVLCRGNLPVVVGGSGLYVRALLDGFDLPGTDANLRAALNSELATHGVQYMFDRLVAIDPAAAAVIGNSNARRIVRALEVIELTGKPFVANLPAPSYRHNTVTIGLDFDRVTLDNRITQRVTKMRSQGLLAEVSQLASPEQGGVGPGLGPTAIRAVGYYELLPALQGGVGENDAFDQIALHTRQLTRKQMGWFGRDSRVKWFNGAAADLVSQVADYLVDPGAAPQTAVEPVRTPLGSTLIT
jgi:tRNA dimethylallyltransferase